MFARSVDVVIGLRRAALLGAVAALAAVLALTALPAAAAVPGAPTDVTFVPIPNIGNTGRLTLTWTAVTSDPALVGYRVQYREQGTSLWTAETIENPDATGYEVDGLNAFTAYEAEVAAYNLEGDTQQFSDYTRAEGPALALSATLSDDGQTIVVAYSERLDTSVTPAEERFMVSVDLETAVAPSSVFHTAGDDTSVTLVVDSRVPVAASASISYTDADQGPVTGADGNRTVAFTGLTTEARPDGILVKNWDQTSRGTAGSIFSSTSELIEGAQGFTTGSHAAGYVLDKVWLDVSGAEPGDTAVGRIYRANADGTPGPAVYDLTGPASGFDSTAEAYVLSAPDDAILEPSTAYVLVLSPDVLAPSSSGFSWDQVGTGQDSGSAAGWTITNSYHTSLNSAPWTSESGRAGNIALFGAEVESALVPAQPTGVMVTGGDHQLAVSWTAPATATGVAPTGYDVHYRLSTATEWTELDRSDSSAVTEPITGLPNQNAYQVQVRAVNGPYFGTWTATATGSTVGAVGTDATLSGLSLSDVTLAETFSSGLTSYTGTTGSGTSRTTIAATTTHPYASIRILDESNAELTDADDAEDGFQVDLAPGSNTIKVGVTAEDKVATTTYDVVVTRALPVVRIQSTSGGSAFYEYSEIASFPVTIETVLPEDLVVLVSVTEVTDSGTLLASGQIGTHEVTIGAGDPSERLVVMIADDDVWEPHSEVTAAILPSPNYQIGSDQASATETIEDDDFPRADATLAVNPSAPDKVAEGETVTVTVTVTTRAVQEPHKATGDLQLDTAYGTASAADHSTLAAAVSFDPADMDFVRSDIDPDPNAETFRYQATDSFTVTIVDDSNREPDETFTISMSTVTTGPEDSRTDTNISLSGTTSRTVTIEASNLSDNTDLASVGWSSGTLSGTFSAGLDSTYSATVPFGVSQITVTPTLADTNADTNASVAWLDSGDMPLADASSAAGHQVNLGTDDTTFKIVVTADDGVTTETHTVTVSIGPPELSVSAARASVTEGSNVVFTVSRNARSAAATDLTLNIVDEDSEGDDGGKVAEADEGLQDLTIGANQLSVSYTVATQPDDGWEPHTAVEAVVQADVGHTVSATAGSASSIVLDDDFPMAEATYSVDSNTALENDTEGPNAGDTVTATITVTTDGDEEPHADGGSISLSVATSGTASASDITAPGSNYLTFPAASFTRVDINNDENDRDWRYRFSRTRQVKIVNDTVKEPDEWFAFVFQRSTLAGQQTHANIEVVPPSDPSDYIVTIVQSDRSSDASLTALSLSAGGLVQEFAAGTLNYDAQVPFGHPQVTVTPTQADFATAQVQDINGNPLDTNSVVPGAQVDLELNTPLTVKILVTAEDEITERTYTVSITRQLPELTISVPATPPSLPEGTPVVATVTRNGSTSDETAFSVEITDPSTVVDSLETGRKDFVIAAGTDSVDVSVPTVVDDDWDAHASVSVELLADTTSYDISGAATVSKQVLDDDFPDATAELSVSNYQLVKMLSEVDEGNPLTVTVTVTAERADEEPHEGGGTLQVTTMDGPDPDGDCPDTCKKGEATGGSDYSAIAGAAGALNFVLGDFAEEDIGGGVMRWRASKDITITTTDELVDEFEEHFTVLMAKVDTGPAPTDGNIDLGTASRTVEFTRSDLSDDAGLRNIGLSAGELAGTGFVSTTTDYDATVGFPDRQITITPATKDTAASFVWLQSDGTTTLADASTLAGFQVDLPSVGVEVIVKIEVTAQDEMTTLTYTLAITRQHPVASISVAGTEEPEGDDIVFTVSLDGPAEAISGRPIDVEVTEPADGETVLDGANSGITTVTVPMGDTSATLTVDTVDDDTWEPHTEVTATILVRSDYTVSESSAAAALTVNDDDFPEADAELTVTPNPVDEPPATLEGVSTGTRVTSVQVKIRTRRDEQPREGAGQIQVSTADDSNGAVAGSDYTALAGVLLNFDLIDFQPVPVGGNTAYQATQTVSIPIAHDNEEEPDETFTVTMAPVADTDPNPTDSQVTLGVLSETVTISANDVHEVTGSTPARRSSRPTSRSRLPTPA